jgi:ATP-dependent helicase HrpB
VAAEGLGLAGLACELAAVLSERDPLRAEPGRREADLRLRLELLRDPRMPLPPGVSADRGGAERARLAAKEWKRRLKAGGAAADADEAGRVLALAYPDRVGRRRTPEGAGYLLTGGRGAALAEGDPLRRAEWLAVAALDAGGRDARIFLAAPLERSDVEALFAERIAIEETVAWDPAERTVLARRRRRLGAVVLSEEPLADVPPEALADAVLQAVHGEGLGCLPWTEALLAWRHRVRFLRANDADPGRWPDLSDAALAATLDDWLAPFLAGLARRDPLGSVPLAAALEALLPGDLRRELEAEAPAKIAVPGGSRLRLDYGAEGAPVLAVRLQEMFGLAETPRVAWGRVPVVLHLLSPAGRPVQITRDLASFWANAYAAVKADLKGRYPKHVWPDDPLRAAPTARAKRRSG